MHPWYAARGCLCLHCLECMHHLLILCRQLDDGLIGGLLLYIVCQVDARNTLRDRA